jgi:hypothetical protein
MEFCQDIALLYHGRIALFENGYEPIPILAAKKKPLIKGWTTGEITAERIFAETTRHTDHLSTGLRTGKLCGIDIDLRDPEHADNIRFLVEQTLGETTLRRRGSKGFMLCYRNPGEPLGKLVIRDTALNKTLVEIFGKGGQFVAYGIHPDTHHPYQWLVPDREPFWVPITDLPEVSSEQLIDLIGIISTRLVELGYLVEKREKAAVARVTAPGTGTTDAACVTDLFLQFISGSPNHSGWINFRCPACNCADGRAGFRVTATGGFKFSCFHTGCEYFDTTGWEPGGILGKRTRALYEKLGGHPDDLPVSRPRYHAMKGFVSLKEMMDEMRIELGLATGHGAARG